MPRMRAIDSVGRIHIYDIKDMAWVDDTGFVESSAATDGGEDGRMLQHPSRLLFFFISTQAVPSRTASLLRRQLCSM